jgi:hypothetical protein
MKSMMAAVMLASAFFAGGISFGAPLRFEKVSDHCYYLPLKGGTQNIFAVITDEGVLLADPPAEPDLSVTVEALKRLNPKPVRWVIFSNPRALTSPGARFFAEQGAAILAGNRLRTLSSSLESNPGNVSGSGSDLSAFPWMVFDRQVHVYPANIEVRISAIQNKARTGGDVFIFIPMEKVLFVGGLFEAGRYPEIDSRAEGDAGEWINGLKQLVDSIPVLKSAFQQPAKPDPKAPQPEKTTEEGIAVISASGEASNFQNTKDLLSIVQKLRADTAKAIKSGRSCENFLGSSRADLYRVYGNFDAYAAQLCASVSAAPEK